MKYPAEITSNSDKLAYCYAAQEKLRLAHNVVGTWSRTGVMNSKEYETLPSIWKAALPEAKAVLTEADWNAFTGDTFLNSSKLIIGEMLPLREAVTKDPVLHALVDLDKILIEEADGDREL